MRSTCRTFSQVHTHTHISLDLVNGRVIVIYVCVCVGNGKVSGCGAEGSFTSLTGLLEVEPLHFTCVSTSDGTRVERDDASMFTGTELSLYSSHICASLLRVVFYIALFTLLQYSFVSF